jgi:hypothetical protein
VPDLVAGREAMTATRLGRLFWRVADHLDYLVTLPRLRILDALAGPEPETPADQERLRRVPLKCCWTLGFPDIRGRIAKGRDFPCI